MATKNIAELAPISPAVTDNADSDIVRIVVVLGDRNKDHKVDVTGMVQVRMPFAGWGPPVGLTGNVPIKQALQVGSAMVALIPGGAGQFASRALGLAAGAIGAVESLLIGR